MVKEYVNGNDFYEENKDILLSEKYNEPFFRLDSPLLLNAGKEEYALKVTDGKIRILSVGTYHLKNIKTQWNSFCFIAHLI